MIRSLLLLLTAVAFFSCSNSKKTPEKKAQETPKAQIQIAPGHVQASINIKNIEVTDNQRIVTADVVEVLKYGSATDPLPAGTTIRFEINDDFSKEMRSKIKINTKLDATVFHQNQEMMMGGSQNSISWKLISINN